MWPDELLGDRDSLEDVRVSGSHSAVSLVVLSRSVVSSAVALSHAVLARQDSPVHKLGLCVCVLAYADPSPYNLKKDYAGSLVTRTWLSSPWCDYGRHTLS